MHADSPTILYCHCHGADVVDPQVKHTVLAGLRASGRPFVAVNDLCARAARGDELLAQIAAGKTVKIAACHERAVRCLFAAAEAPLSDKDVEIVTMIGRGAEEVLDRLLPGSRAAVGPAEAAGVAPPEPPADRVAWFPVIDYDRCTDCQQCLNFCLFGVYEATDDGKVKVARPDNCKLNCPACARICPQTAIIFPKHPCGPINGGEGPPTGSGGADLAELLKGDVYQALRNRQIEPSVLDLQRAIEERSQCSTQGCCDPGEADAKHAGPCPCNQGEPSPERTDSHATP